MQTILFGKGKMLTEDWMADLKRLSRPAFPIRSAFDAEGGRWEGGWGGADDRTGERSVGQ